MSYYDDSLSKWYISSNGKFSTFLNQIKDFDLKDRVDTILEMRREDPSFDTRFEYPVDGSNEKFSIWIDDNENKNKLYRLTPPEGIIPKKISNLVDTKINPSYNSSYGSSGSSRSKFPTGYFDSKSKKLVTWEEYVKLSDEDYNIRLLTPKEVTPTCFLIFDKEGNEILKVWIGKYIPPKKD